MARHASLLEPSFLARLERLELNVRRLLAGEHRGDFATKRQGSGTLFREHRPYVPGDDPRFLDWNAFMRLDHLQVKTFEAEETPRVVLLVDRSASMGLREEAKLRRALELAAALGAVSLLRHAALTVALFPHEERVMNWRGRGALVPLLKTLGDVESKGQAEWMAAVQRACPKKRAAGWAFVISDFFENEAHQQALRWLRHRGFAVHALHIRDERDAEIQAGELLEIADAETGRVLKERVDRRLAAGFREAMAEHLRTVEKACRALQVKWWQVDLEVPLERTVMDVLRYGLASN